MVKKGIGGSDKKPEPPAAAKKGAPAAPAAKGKAEPEQPSSRRAAIKQPVSSGIDKKKGAGRKLTQEEIDKAAAEGRKIVAYSPNEMELFLKGHRTLGEIQGISKEEQYKMAEVGYRLLSEGKLAEGKQVFFGLCALDPFDSYFITCLASAHQQENDAKEAERLYTRALEINPWNVTARTHRGELRALDGRLSDAVDDLTRALQDDPKGNDPAVKRAAVLLRAIQAQLKNVS